jgi:hypothetical protein
MLQVTLTRVQQMQAGNSWFMMHAHWAAFLCPCGAYLPALRLLLAVWFCLCLPVCVLSWLLEDLL